MLLTNFHLLTLISLTIATNEKFKLSNSSTVSSHNSSMAVISIIENFYMKISTTVQITLGYSSKMHKNIQGELLNSILSEVNTEITLTIEQYLFINKKSTLRFFNIFLVDSYSAFRYTIQ